MHVGVGLPTGLPGTDGQRIIEWARLAEEGPFTSLGVIDRLVYDSYDPLISLAAAAAVTRRVKLATTIIVGLLHNTPVLAKMLASVDALSGGRLVVGMAVGARKEDYEAAGVDFRSRGKRLSEQLTALRSLWEDGDIGPKGARPSGPPLLVGGLSDQGFARVARYADGYVHGGGPPRAFARAADKARHAAPLQTNDSCLLTQNSKLKTQNSELQSSAVGLRAFTAVCSSRRPTLRTMSP